MVQSWNNTKFASDCISMQTIGLGSGIPRKNHDQSLRLLDVDEIQLVAVGHNITIRNFQGNCKTPSRYDRLLVYRMHLLSRHLYGAGAVLTSRSLANNFLALLTSHGLVERVDLHPLLAQRTRRAEQVRAEVAEL
jgi:hypothetical protein